MVKNVLFDLDAVFEEVVERGRANGITSFEAYSDLCEEMLFEEGGEGEMHDDENVQMRFQALRGRFDEYLEQIQ